jgi:uncharacterized membrane protein
MTPEEKRDIEENRELAAFSYFLFFSPLLLYTRRDSSFIQFHSKQAVVLFFLTIVLTSLGDPFHYGIFLILAICLTGLIQANQGRKWKIPFIANIIESGFSVDSILKSIVHYTHVLKQIFISPSRSCVSSVSEKKDLFHIVELQEQKIAFLEREILLQTVLKGKKMIALSSRSQGNISRFVEEIMDILEGGSKEEKPFCISCEKEAFEVFVGGFSESVIQVYFSGASKNAVGRYVGVQIHLENTQEREKILMTIQNIFQGCEK